MFPSFFAKLTIPQVFFNLFLCLLSFTTALDYYKAGTPFDCLHDSKELSRELFPLVLAASEPSVHFIAEVAQSDNYSTGQSHCQLPEQTSHRKPQEGVIIGIA